MILVDSNENITISQGDNALLVIDLFNGEDALTLSSDKSFVLTISSQDLNTNIATFTIVGVGTSQVEIPLNLKLIPALVPGLYKYDTKILNSDDTYYYNTFPKDFKVVKQAAGQ